MKIRQTLEKWFGEETIYKIFESPLGLKADHPVLNDDIPYCTYVGVVEGQNWRPDQLSFHEFEEGEVLNNFLIDVSKLYEKLFERQLKLRVSGTYLNPDAHIFLGTRSKTIREYLRSYQTDKLKLM